MDNKRVIYLDVLRIIAILMMMMIHVSGGYLGGLMVCSVQWNIAEVFQSVSRCCITLFFMISGIFFLDDKKDVTLKSLFTRNIKRIVTAFLFWSLFYAVFACINEKTSDVKTLVKVFIQQTSSPIAIRISYAIIFPNKLCSNIPSIQIVSFLIY